MPYELSGNGKDGQGIDCYELVVQLGQHYGFNYPTPQYEYDIPSRNSVADSNRKFFTRIDLPRFGDIIAIKIGCFVAHIGFMINHYQFIHAIKEHGVTISRVDSIKYRNRIEGYYRCKN